LIHGYSGIEVSAFCSVVKVLSGEPHSSWRCSSFDSWLLKTSSPSLSGEGNLLCRCQPSTPPMQSGLAYDQAARSSWI